MGKSIMDRIATIKTHCEREARDARIAEKSTSDTIAALRSEIKRLAPRIADLIKVANVCGENGVCLGPEPVEGESPKFVTEMWYHNLGFYAYAQNTDRGRGDYKHLHIGGFGFAGGGVCGESFLVNSDGEIYRGWTHTPETLIELMRSLLGKFDKFETEFYEYIDNLQ